jgi:hypothetical protein
MSCVVAARFERDAEDAKAWLQQRGLLPVGDR